VCSFSFVTFQPQSEHIKSISESLDKTHEALLHLTAVLDGCIKDDTLFAKQFVPLDRLVNQYKIRPADAFHALRRVLHIPTMQGSDDTETMNGGADASVGMDIDEGAAPASSTAVAASASSTSPYARLIRTVRPFLPPSVWSSLSPSFYALFWRLSLSALHVPTRTYENHIAKLKSLVPGLSNEFTNSGVLKTPLQKKQSAAEKERLARLVKDLSVELDTQTTEVAANYKLLALESQTWFEGITQPALSMSAFLEHCLLPRALHSGIDAHFAAKFVRSVLS
jgi:hypothetical protein